MKGTIPLIYYRHYQPSMIYWKVGNTGFVADASKADRPRNVTNDETGERGVLSVIHSHSGSQKCKISELGISTVSLLKICKILNSKDISGE